MKGAMQLLKSLAPLHVTRTLLFEWQRRLCFVQYYLLVKNHSVENYFRSHNISIREYLLTLTDSVINKESLKRVNVTPSINDFTDLRQM
jgi:hypothetical protein